MIKIHFTYSDSFFSKIIRLFTGDKYTHIEIEINGSCYSAKPFKGVYKQSYINLKNTYNNNLDTFFIEYLTKLQTEKIETFLKAQVGKGYDYKSAIACGLWQRDWANDLDRWFCSELVAKALSIAGVHAVNQYYRPYKLTPKDISLSPILIK